MTELFGNQPKESLDFIKFGFTVPNLDQWYKFRVKNKVRFKLNVLTEQVANKPYDLLTTITGIRITAIDSFGNILPNIFLCVYDNLNLYNQNFQNCGGGTSI